MGVFYKRSKLRVIESGNFWLSETPEVAGSQAAPESEPHNEAGRYPSDHFPVIAVPEL